ncbi:MAG: hypothetical protein ABI813_14730, partial [Bacteroidota bacterium]
MLPTFHHKFRIPSARAAWWNYQDAAAYFITICTQNKRHFFGEITVETPCMASPPQTPDMASPQFTQKTPDMASLR